MVQKKRIETEEGSFCPGRGNKKNKGGEKRSGRTK